jgi:superfamily II DNA or RNA helicase
MTVFTVGSLVKARGREWVVLPESDDETLVVRPLGGTDDEIAGIYLPLETVTSAQFDLPDPTKVGDYRSARLLRDAVRLGFRSSAGPFRSFARLAFEPRPYQLVPLMIALKLDPVRLMISDDVGIGKTIEAGLIARELLDRGEVERFAILCPPQLAEQWQAELREKFNIEAELVLPGTAARLERGLSLGQSLFERHPFVVVSLDFIKTDRRRDEFLRTCPELIIVDEAHTCASQNEKGGKQQRHQLIRGLAENPNRHIILVTATPHSGKEEAFRSLLTILDEEFENLPDDLSGAGNERHRRSLAQHFIQRRRADIRHYMDADTPFPDREESESTYKLSPEYKKLFERVLDYARETVRDTSGGQFHQRVRWWSALALLRSLASSPAAAAETLRNRAEPKGDENAEEQSDRLQVIDDIGQRNIMDLVTDSSAEGTDVAPGGNLGENEDQGSRRLLLELARMADGLLGAKDEKLNKVIELLKDFLQQGYRPILFCRYIPTAEYVATELRKQLKGVEVAAVTGLLPPSEREERVLQLSESEKRVLVCTDCLSEGINLQAHFDAVIHYDLSWNPTRHEQREGRVDRYGQQKSKVRVLTYYGTDNQIDGIVLDVLLRKHKAIRNSLGISVPVPVDTEKVVEAIFEGLLLRSRPTAMDNYLPGFEDYMKPIRNDLYGKWEAVSEREKRSRTVFAQESIKPDEVAGELRAAREAVGSGVDVSRFVKEALQIMGAGVGGNDEVLAANLADLPLALKERLLNNNLKSQNLSLKFALPVGEKQLLVTRTHPFVENLASYLLESALDPLGPDPLRQTPARRCGAMRTSQVQKRTTLLLLRFRYHIITNRENVEKPLLAEDVQVVAFRGAPESAEWLDAKDAEELLGASSDQNMTEANKVDAVSKIMDGFEALRPQLNVIAVQHGNELLAAHQRVRRASKMRSTQSRVEPQLPPDVLGIYVYLPKVA